MRSRYASLLSLMLIAACSKHQPEKVSVVCQGTEVTSGKRADGTLLETDSINVVRTINLEKQTKKILDGVLIIEYGKPNSGDRKEISELTDVLRIDANREIYKESSITNYSRKTTTNYSSVSVNSERIAANQEVTVEYMEAKDKELSNFRDYSITIDRVSGVFKEVLKEGGTVNSKSDSFRIETIGTCKKAEQKF